MKKFLISLILGLTLCSCNSSKYTAIYGYCVYDCLEDTIYNNLPLKNVRYDYKDIIAYDYLNLYTYSDNISNYPLKGIFKITTTNTEYHKDWGKHHVKATVNKKKCIILAEEAKAKFLEDIRLERQQRRIELAKQDSIRKLKLQENPYGEVTILSCGNVKHHDLNSSKKPSYGIMPTIKWECYDSSQRIKYIEFSIIAYNSAGDRINIIYPSASNICKYTVGSNIKFKHSYEFQNNIVTFEGLLDYYIYFDDQIDSMKIINCRVKTYDDVWHYINIDNKFYRI